MKKRIAERIEKALAKDSPSDSPGAGAEARPQKAKKSMKPVSTQVPARVPELPEPHVRMKEAVRIAGVSRRTVERLLRDDPAVGRLPSPQRRAWIIPISALERMLARLSGQLQQRKVK